MIHRVSLQTKIVDPVVEHSQIDTLNDVAERTRSANQDENFTTDECNERSVGRTHGKNSSMQQGTRG